jgi:protein SCO1/2
MMFRPSTVLAAAFFLTAIVVSEGVRAQTSGFEGYSSSGRDAASSNNQVSVPSQTRPPVLKDLKFEQRINEQIPPGLHFTDETGREIVLDSYFGKKPVVLAFVYYTCPMLCSQVMEGLTTSLKAVPFRPGEDFDVVVVSIDPKDTPDRAASKKRTTLARYGREKTAPGWHFLTGREEEIGKLAASAGYNYTWDAAGRQFAHASGIIVVNPEKRFYRYFYGVDYPAKDLKLALVDAGKGKVGTVVDQVLLFCYHYDPAQGRYTALTIGILRLAALLTMFALFGTIGVLIWRERHKAPAPREAH